MVALVREFYGLNLERKEEHLLLPLIHPGGPAFLIALSQWLGMLVVVYFVYRLLGRRVGIKLHDKTLAKHKDDILRLVYFGMTMAAVGGIATRIEEGVVNTETGLPFIPLTLAYCVFFTFIFELVKERDITLSIGLFENKVGMLVVFLAFCTCLLVLVALFLTAWQVSTSFFAMYLGVCLVGLFAHIAMFCPVIPGVAGRSHLHLHHWYWSVPLAHMCVFHTDVSMLAQAIFLAVHIHGVDCFRVEPLFYDTERRARHPSDFGKCLMVVLVIKLHMVCCPNNNKKTLFRLDIEGARSRKATLRFLCPGGGTTTSGRCSTKEKQCVLFRSRGHPR